MCRFVTQPDGSQVHTGICQNSLWFDNHDGVVFLCRHPDNDTTKAPLFTATLSQEAWAEIDALVTQEAPS